MAVLSKELGLVLDMEVQNDLKDWNTIRDFEHRFVESLRE